MNKMPVEYSIENRNILCSKHRHRRRVFVLSGGLILDSYGGAGPYPWNIFRIRGPEVTFPAF